MLRRVVIGVVCGVAGYVIGGFGGALLISVMSSNAHDLPVEAAMTGAFVTGPLVGIVAAILGFIKSNRAVPPVP